MKSMGIATFRPMRKSLPEKAAPPNPASLKVSTSLSPLAALPACLMAARLPTSVPSGFSACVSSARRSIA